MKWDPENYYPRINCPALMMFGDKDVNIDALGSIENSKRIIEAYNKKNISLVVMPGLDHSFCKPGSFVEITEKGGKKTKIKVRDPEYYRTVIDWIYSL